MVAMRVLEARAERRESSSLSSRTIVLNAAVAQLVEYLLAKQDVTGSNPVSRSIHALDDEKTLQYSI